MKFWSKSKHSLLSPWLPFQQWGQGLVEFALVLPIFLITLFVLIEGAFIIQGYLTVQHAAREAARWAVTYQPPQGAKVDETDCEGTSVGSDLAYYVSDAVDAGNDCYIGEDEDEYNARRVALIEKVALHRAAGLRIDWESRGLTETSFDANHNEPGFFGVRVVGDTWDETAQSYNAGVPGLPVTVTVVHRVELVDPLLRAIAPDGVRVQASANMVNEGVLVRPPDASDDGEVVPVETAIPPEDPTPVPSATPTLPPEANYCLQISFDHVTNTLPFERDHDVDVLVTNCTTGDPWPDLPVSFSTTEGAFDYSGVEDPANQYAEAMTDASGVAVRTVYANEPGTADLRVWVDLDGDDTWDSGERYDTAKKTWIVPEGVPYLLASSYAVLPEEVITVDVFNHPVVDEPFTLLWCRLSGAGIASSVLITDSIDVDDVSEDALDLPVTIPAGSAGIYQLETHREFPASCGDTGTRVAYSAEIRIRNLPPDLHIVSISYPAIYGDLFPASVDVPLRIEIENLLPWPVEDTFFDIDLYVTEDSSETPVLRQIGVSKQWLANIAGYETQVVTVEHRIDDFGTFYLWAQVDTSDYVEESDETNNIFGPYPIDVECTVFSSDYGDDFDDGSFDSKWSTAEMGSNVDGSVTEDGGGDLQIHGRGSSIWGTSDNFFYVYQSISGDFDVRLRAVSPPPNGGAKVGVMVRNSTAANSRHVMATARDADGRRLQFAYRTEDGDATSYAGSELNVQSPPVWLRIVRSGDDFAYYYSHDELPGDNWTLHSSGAAVDMGDTVQVGIVHAKYSGSGSTYTSRVDEFVVCRPAEVSSALTAPGMKECTQHFEAQNFEGNLSNIFPPWQAGDSPSAWQRDGYFPYGGAFSVHLHASLGGYPCTANNPWLAQTVQVPTDVTTTTYVTIEGYRAVGGSRSECSLRGTTDADDSLYVEILDGSSNPSEFIVDGGVITDTWQPFSVEFSSLDLESLAGQDIQARFYTVHDGDQYGTYFYLDNLSLNICTEEPIPEDVDGTASIGGMVLQQGSIPMPGVEVIAYSPGGQVYHTLSIHDATYHFYNIPPGTYTVYAEAWIDGVLKSDFATVTVVSDERNYYIYLRLQ